MSQSTVLQKYKLSVVSGGKPILPRGFNPSHTNKSVACLTVDQLNYIVPFNNQIKIYSTETRQCVKTLKYLNSQQLSDIFENGQTQLVDISLAVTPEDNEITLLTNDGRIISLNYRGKLTNAPKVRQISLEEGESVSKLFITRENTFKILTTKPVSHGSVFTYRIYTLKFEEEIKLFLEHTIDEVILSCWSSNEKFIA